MRILVVAAHPDDAEIGMGGSIAKFAADGHDVLICDVTDGSPTPRGDRGTRLREAAAALECLKPEGGAGSAGGKKTGSVERILLDFPNRTLQHTIESRHAVAAVIRAHRADMVFAPQDQDAHPDHLALTRICEDARFDAKLSKLDLATPPGMEDVGPPRYVRWFFYYDISHLRHTRRPDFLLDITGYELKKQRSLKAYRSQFGPWDDGGAGLSEGDPKAGKPDAGKLVSVDFPERMLAYATWWGSRIGVPYAEPFFTKEPVGLGSLEGLA